MNDMVFSLRNAGKSRPGADGFRLHIANLDIARGSLQALVGPSGCGKSTALDMLACILCPDLDMPEGSSAAEQRFQFNPLPNGGTDVLQTWRNGGLNTLARLRQHHLGYVQQTGGLLPFLDAYDNITLRCSCLGCADARRQQIQDIVDGLGIKRLLNQYPATLSVGERQRVAIAAALAHAPEMVLADEPTAALDPVHARNALRIFANLAQKMGITVLMVTHNLEMAVEAGFSPIQVTLDQSGPGSISRIDHRVEQKPLASGSQQQGGRA
ncbi:MAG: ATP-binding cassette domain-containing protein [Desulfovibrio sp.]|nr:ATP-binding cassette domain-containing protein [Desulfovibrio sp.]